MADTVDTSATGGGLDPLAEFTLNLAKAMLRTGYYAPDHPEAKQSLAGLHKEFRRTVGNQSEITYLVGKTGDAETVMVQGRGEGPEALDHIMIRGMAELFTPKLLDFFHRRHLVSFSLLKTIEPVELSAFVTLMSEPPKPGRAHEERARVEEALLGRHIINVSTVFEADILGRERRLPWRVELALSRLGRDLRMVPLYQRASDEELQKAKIQIIDDLIRPLQSPEVVRDLLLNCDLLAEDIEGLGSAQIEQEIIAQVPQLRLQATCRSLVDDLAKEKRGEGGVQDDLAARRRLVLREVVLGLTNESGTVEGELIEACVKLGVATLEELPKGLRAQLKRRRAVDTYLVRKEEYLQALGNIPPGAKGAPLVKTADVFFTGLLNRELYTEAAGILQVVRTGNQEGGSAKAARQLIDGFRRTLADPETLGPLIAELKNEDHGRPVIEALIDLIVLAGEPAAEPLRDLYGKSESRFVRAHVFDAIKGIGAPALVPFLVHLDGTEGEWSALHHILAGLAGLEDPALAKPIALFLTHENAHVRQAALTRTFELLGEASARHLTSALGDADPLVRHAAVAYLAKLPKPRPEALAFIKSALRPEQGAKSTETADEVLVEICHSIPPMAEAAPEHAKDLEELLVSALVRSEQGGILGRIRKPALHFSERVRIAICEALGSVGTERALAALRACASEEGEVKKAAVAAVERIEGENRG